MEHNNIPQFSNNFPGYRNFNYSATLEESMDNNSSKNASFRPDLSESASLFFSRDYSWEYFSNELEFE